MGYHYPLCIGGVMSDIHIDTARLDQIAAQLDMNRKKILDALALEVEGAAKINAPVALGALRNSIYTDNGKESGYSQAASAAKGANPSADTEAAPSPDDKHVIVCACVNYAAYVELGTSKMGAQPYLVPALESKVSDLNSGKTWEALITK
jgi:HK97 gp10 family phage protein